MYIEAADDDHADAQRRLGWTHENGEFNLAIDSEAVITLYQEAAGRWRQTSQWRLGVAYNGDELGLKGDLGLLTDEEEALKWHRKAADGDHADLV